MAREVQCVTLVDVVATAGIDQAEYRVAGIAVQRPETGLLQVVEIGILTVRAIERDDRVRTQCVGDIVPVLVADTDTLLHAIDVGHVLTECDDVQTVLLEKHVVGIQAYGGTLVVRLARISEDTFLAGVAYTRGELGQFAAADDVDSVVGNRGIGIVDGLKPVGAGEGTVLDAVVKV